MEEHLHVLKIGSVYTRTRSLCTDGAPACGVRKHETACVLSQAQIPDEIPQEIMNEKHLSRCVQVLSEENGWGKEDHLAVILPDSPAWCGRREREAFAQQIREAAGVRDVIPVSAARASACRYLTERPQDIYAEKITVLHFGAARADAVWIENGQKKGSFSRNLAAEQIENLMVQAAMREAVKQNGAFRPDPDSVRRVRDEMRREKERCFSEGKTDPAACCFTDAASGEQIRVTVPADASAIGRIMREEAFTADWDGLPCRDTWEGLCRKFIAEAAQLSGAQDAESENGGRRNTVILTGGAAAMPLIREICAQTFPQGAVILTDPEPGDTPLYGINRFLFLDDEAYEKEKAYFCEHTVGDLFFYYLRNFGIWDDLFRDRLSETAFGTLCDLVMEQMGDLAEQGQAVPKGSVRKRIRGALYRDRTSLSPAFEKACARIGMEWKSCQWYEVLGKVCRMIHPDADLSFEHAAFFPERYFRTEDAAFLLPGTYDGGYWLQPADDSWRDMPGIYDDGYWSASDSEPQWVEKIRDIFDARDLMKMLQIRGSGLLELGKVQPEVLKDCAENGRQRLEENRHFVMLRFKEACELLPCGYPDQIAADLLDLAVLRHYEEEKQPASEQQTAAAGTDAG